MIWQGSNHEEREANRILDLWKAGASEEEGITGGLVDWALRVTGDSIGLRDFIETNNWTP